MKDEHFLYKLKSLGSGEISQVPVTDAWGPEHLNVDRRNPLTAAICDSNVVRGQGMEQREGHREGALQGSWQRFLSGAGRSCQLINHPFLAIGKLYIQREAHSPKKTSKAIKDILFVNFLPP